MRARSAKKAEVAGHASKWSSGTRNPTHHCGVVQKWLRRNRVRESGTTYVIDFLVPQRGFEVARQRLEYVHKIVAPRPPYPRNYPKKNEC
jgi:hypothetical protein